MNVGDRVMFSRAFCRSVGLHVSNDPLVHRSQGGERKVLTTNLVLITAQEIE